MCAPEFSDLETSLWQPFKDRDVIVLGASSEPIDVIRQFVANQGVTFPILYDAGNDVYNKYFLSGGVSPYPRDFIFDQNGIIRYANIEYDSRAMALIVAALLDSLTFVTSGNGGIPVHYTLEQNYPNPFNSSTVISFTLSRKSRITLSIYNTLGQKVVDLASGFFEVGKHNIKWNGKDNNSTPLPAGVYLYKLDVQGISLTRKLALIR